MSAPRPPRVVVLGGGSAGWMTAALLAQRWLPKGGAITVAESPAIGIIGVGEGSTPQLKAFFDLLGVAEGEWMPACDATWKLGIRFTGWSEAPGHASYFHPFPGPTDLHSEPGFIRNCAIRRRGFDVPAHPDGFFLATRLADAARAPHADPRFPFAPSYGYHFDAHKLGGFLRQWCVARGVVHRAETIAHVDVGADGNVAALVTDAGERIEGDLFVDCSGFRAMIAEQALGARFLPFAENLFNDRAVVLPTPRAGAAIVPATEAIAMRAGWRWSIPLTTRTGNGYVYASAHVSPDDAERELRAALGVGDEVEARHLAMKVGRLADSWTANCLAVGLAQGFIEPLEATALHIVIATALEFADAYEAGGGGPTHRDRFNASIAARYEGIRDYIVAHYRMSRRTDTDYWRACAANRALSDPLAAMITAWFTQGDMAEANDRAYAARHYSDASWHCLFAGYGQFPAPEKLRPLPPGSTGADVTAIDAMLAACAANFAEYAP